MRTQSMRGWFDDLSEEDKPRYIRYFDVRLPGKAPRWVWHYWNEPEGMVIRYHIGPGYEPWDAKKYGSPFNGYDAPDEKVIYRADNYYQERMPWRRWGFGSAKCFAARLGNRCVEDRT